MSRWFQAVAFDYDNTLASAPRPSAEVLAAMSAARAAGLRLVLVTGRILAELRVDFPDVDAHFDAIVGENGAVLMRGDTGRLLAPPVPSALAEALGSAGVPLRRGRVLLATTVEHDAAVIDAVRRLGLEVQIVHNRGALMVLPPNASKGTGLDEALAELGMSVHNCVAVGDAENDHSLLDAAEVGIAVENAIEALKAHADRVLTAPGDEGIIGLLRELVNDGLAVRPRRWQVDLGTFDDGTPARIPGSRVSMLVHGGSGTGKSYLAGLLAEGLLDLGYTLCVLDLEGDHPQLGDRRGVVTVGGVEGLVPPEHVVRLIRHQLASVVVDLSLEPFETRRAYARTLVRELLDRRAESGLPHWILVDEAHVPLGPEFDAACLSGRPTGLCLVTYRPDELCRAAAAVHDVDIDVRSPDCAVLRGLGEPARMFRPKPRVSAHVRHWHKYTALPTSEPLRFWFRNPHGRTGRSAGHLPEFDVELRAASDAVVGHHAVNGDFSRWIQDVFRDGRLADTVRDAERRVRSGMPAARARSEILRALEARYLDGRPA